MNCRWDLHHRDGRASDTRLQANELRGSADGRVVRSGTYAAFFTALRFGPQKSKRLF